MFKREIKVNLKSFIVWLSILIGLFLVVFLIYPSIVTDENIEMMNEMMSIFPEDVLKAFNMDISGIDTAFGWLKSEGYVFVLLITGVYSGILGSSILLKEESDKTIEYLNSLPITRNEIVISKLLCGFIYIILMILVLGLFNFIGLSLSGDFDVKTYILLSLTPMFSSLVIFVVCLFMSTFTHKTKKTLGISLGIVFFSYFLQVVSEITKDVEWLKYFSIYTLADIRNVILDGKINLIMVIVSVLMVCLFSIMTCMRYSNKDLV